MLHIFITQQELKAVGLAITFSKRIKIKKTECLAREAFYKKPAISIIVRTKTGHVPFNLFIKALNHHAVNRTSAVQRDEEAPDNEVLQKSASEDPMLETVIKVADDTVVEEETLAEEGRVQRYSDDNIEDKLRLKETHL
ncbi:hypothetical protein ACJX0J_008866 [Zea mays]